MYIGIRLVVSILLHYKAAILELWVSHTELQIGNAARQSHLQLTHTHILSNTALQLIAVTYWFVT